MSGNVFGALIGRECETRTREQKKYRCTEKLPLPSRIAGSPKTESPYRYLVWNRDDLGDFARARPAARPKFFSDPSKFSFGRPRNWEVRVEVYEEGWAILNPPPVSSTAKQSQYCDFYKKKQHLQSPFTENVDVAKGSINTQSRRGREEGLDVRLALASFGGAGRGPGPGPGGPRAVSRRLSPRRRRRAPPRRKRR